MELSWFVCESNKDSAAFIFVYDRPLKTKTSLKRGQDPYTMVVEPKLLTRHISPKRTFDSSGNSTPYVLYEDKIVETLPVDSV